MFKGFWSLSVNGSFVPQSRPSIANLVRPLCGTFLPITECEALQPLYRSYADLKPSHHTRVDLANVKRTLYMRFMDKRTEIITGAMRTFEAQGFRGIGVDAVLAPSGASTRTLYKHFGSRDGLVLAVIEQRHRAFMDRLAAAPDSGIAGLFDALSVWLQEFGPSGCMLLRAHGEYAGSNAEIVACVRRQKAEFLVEFGRRISQSVGRQDDALAVQVWLLFEGATAAASVVGAHVVGAAKEAAETLLAQARSE